eukprot:TRINITY_DN686_c0_g1_i3.p1 TRINITY_DN686_c0_g1~~TRINITY_DN686_c0_g1_i3.p1  ORF type:complete len:304 (+),score=62.22 TRINITY_DN686_c0_g1_i3:78-989(+)
MSLTVASVRSLRRSLVAQIQANRASPSSAPSFTNALSNFLSSPTTRRVTPKSNAPRRLHSTRSTSALSSRASSPSPSSHQSSHQSIPSFSFKNSRDFSTATLAAYPPSTEDSLNSFCDEEMDQVVASKDHEEGVELRELLRKGKWNLQLEYKKLCLVRDIPGGEVVIDIDLESQKIADPKELIEELASNPEQAVPDIPIGQVEQEDYYKIHIKKDNEPTSLFFECCANRSVFEIDTITTKAPHGDITLKTDELEESGQDAFYEYLNGLNVGDDSPRLVHLALIAYEHEEFNMWLKGVKQVINA